MGLFNLFSKKPSLPPYNDYTWMSINSKWKGIEKLLSENPNALYIAWFPETLARFTKLAEANAITNKGIMASSISSNSLNSKTVIFLEHFPIFSKELALLENVKPNNLLFLNALDEPFFMEFGSPNIKSLMERMGMDENEMIEHSMISKAITNAQKKIEEKVSFEQGASNQEDWFRKNLTNLR